MATANRRAAFFFFGSLELQLDVELTRFEKEVRLHCSCKKEKTLLLGSRNSLNVVLEEIFRYVNNLCTLIVLMDFEFALFDSSLCTVHAAITIHIS